MKKFSWSIFIWTPQTCFRQIIFGRVNIAPITFRQMRPTQYAFRNPHALKYVCWKFFLTTKGFFTMGIYKIASAYIICLCDIALPFDRMLYDGAVWPFENYPCREAVYFKPWEYCCDSIIAFTPVMLTKIFFINGKS